MTVALDGIGQSVGGFAFVLGDGTAVETDEGGEAAKGDFTVGVVTGQLHGFVSTGFEGGEFDGVVKADLNTAARDGGTVVPPGEEVAQPVTVGGSASGGPGGRRKGVGKQAGILVPGLGDQMRGNAEDPRETGQGDFTVGVMVGQIDGLSVLIADEGAGGFGSGEIINLVGELA
ncbi:hypothetical protein ACWFMI_24430 [Nocardiopsis terrae]